jgi:hypothetical protein
MSNKPDLLVKDNLIRHLSEKIEMLDEIKRVSSAEKEPMILQSLLATVISFFESALLDTTREYVYARPDEIREVMLDALQKSDRKKFDKKKIIETGFDNYLIDDFIEEVAFLDIKEKIRKLKDLTGVNVDLGDKRWEWILETIARRNCFIHNDLIANNIYFSQAGQKAEEIDQGEKLEVTKSYLSIRIGHIQSLFRELRRKLKATFKDRDNVAAVRGLWDYIFENRYPLFFDQCWDISDKRIIRYKGPKVKELQGMVSPRTIGLFTAWMSFFNDHGYPDLKYFPYLYYVNTKDRAMISKKLKYLMDCFEKIDFQSFKIKVYAKG